MGKHFASLLFCLVWAGLTESVAQDHSAASIIGYGNLADSNFVTTNTYRSYTGSTYTNGIASLIDNYFLYRSVHGGYANYDGRGYGFYSQGHWARMFMEVVSGNHGTFSNLPSDSPIRNNYLYQQIKGPLLAGTTTPVKATNLNSTWLWGVKSNGDFIIDSGKLGLGIDAPTTTLDVAGVIQADTLMLDGVVGLSLSTTLQSLHIGTSSPGGQNNTFIGFHAGERNTTGQDNTAIGRSALSYNTVGSDNVAFGLDALFINTEGARNVAMGRSSLAANTTGSRNTAVGYVSLYQNSSGADNTALGYGTLASNTTGSENTAVGQNALNANTTGNQNTALGTGAMLLNSTGTYNTAVGYNALNTNTTGSSNTGVGYRALQFNTSGMRNSAFGDGSLRSNTTGTDNTALGYSTLYSNTEGSRNTAVGRAALNHNTTGESNTALGHGALNANTTGSENTAVGQNALYNNTTGEDNVAVGRSSLFRNQVGSFNVALGRTALYDNTSGESNTAVGYGALHKNTVGNDNTALGRSALYDNTTGTKNVGVGMSALGNNTNGHFNTAVGYYAGVAITEASQNTLLGYRAGYNLSKGENNIIIGYDQEAPSDSVSNYLNLGGTLYGDLADGHIGVGIDTPASHLHVKHDDIGDGNAQGIQISGHYNHTIGLMAGISGQSNNGFAIRDVNASTDRLVITQAGNVGIGTNSPGSKLAVNGTIKSKEVIVTVDPSEWADYVFEDDYDLRSLNEVETFIEENGHLPEVPSAAEVGERGVAVGDMQATLLKKTEELTLYLLQQKAQIDTLTQENQNLNSRLQRLEDGKP